VWTSLFKKEIPYLSTKQMIEVDRAMMQDYKIGLIQMMENAGRNLAHLARIRFLDGNPEGKQVIILAGTGGNGGGALVSARRLHNWGAKVHVFITKPDEDFKSVPARAARYFAQNECSGGAGQHNHKHP
jgi:NAD(P)H-hydrate epimerase